MKHILGFAIAVAACVLFFVFPESIPQGLAQAWSTEAFSLPISETGYWLLGMSAALGYAMWWALGVLLRSEAGFSTLIILGIAFGFMAYFGGAFTFVQAGLLIGCGLYATIASMGRASALEESSEASSD